MPKLQPSKIVGGGAAKILYALETAARIGLIDSAKALTAKNACKACGLGMGGQRGGMTNEAGEFPAVCNKSIQAQSTDIQPPIPHSVIDHPLSDFAELNGQQMEQLGRLGDPIYKPAGADRYAPIGWDEAMAIAAQAFAKADPARSFFYSSGRSSNEAGFLLQLLARAYGTNNVNNCSYYCHQATGVGLGTTIGTGTSTVELTDLDLCDFIMVIGANPASNHPRFIHKLKACRDRGGEVIVVNPAREAGLVKFALPKSARSLLSGGSEIASEYLQPQIGGDIALLKGLAKAVLLSPQLPFASSEVEMPRGGVSTSLDTNGGWGKSDRRFIEQHCTGFDAFRDDILSTTWDQIVAGCGIAQVEIERIAVKLAASQNAVFAWGMGITHHLHGSENVEMIANLALLCGQIGRPGAGLLPLRGHSNVQGIGTIGVKPVLPEEVFEAIERELGLSLPTAKGMDTMAAMQAASRGEIDAALIMGGNLFEANPNRAFAADALGQIGFKLFLTTTLNRGHIAGLGDGAALVLPVTARDEEWEPTTQESMFNYVRLSDGGITRLANVRPESAILAELGERLLPGGPIDWPAYAQHRHIRDAIARTVPGMEPLQDIEVAKQEFHIANRLLHEPKFHTEDGKAHFVVCPLPAPRKPGLTLTTVRSEGQFNSIIYEQRDSYRGVEDRWTVMLHPEDIAEAGLSDGGLATLVSEFGRMERVKLKAYDLARGSVMAYYPEANCLTGTAVDPRSRTPSFKATPVRVEAAG